MFINPSTSSSPLSGTEVVGVAGNSFSQHLQQITKHLPKASRFSPVALALVIFGHVAVVAAAIYVNQSVSKRTVAPQPITVSLLKAPVEEKAVVKVLQPVAVKARPKSEPTKALTVEPSPIVVQQTTAPQEHSQPIEEVKHQAEKSEPAITVAEKTPEVEATVKPQEQIPELTDGVAYIKEPTVLYPRASRQAREQGLVLVRVLVDINGLPSQIELHRSSGFERLDEAAIAAVKTARFLPYKRNNLAISAYVKLPIRFSL